VTAVTEDCEAGPVHRRSLNTQLAKMMRANVLAPGSQIEAEYRGVRYTATVDATGGISLPSGDYFTNADEAGKLVRGTRSCSGMAFWHTATGGARISLRDLFTMAQREGRLVRTART
jgi:hypothetical protein